MPTETIAPALSYWESIRSGRALPRRCDIDPTQIPRLLPYIMLVDVLAEDADVTKHFDRATLERLTDPAGYLGEALAVVDRLLARVAARAVPANAG